MCLAKVYVDNSDEEFTSGVTHFEQNDDALRFVTIFGEDKSIAGKVESIDFTESIIRVKTAQ